MSLKTSYDEQVAIPRRAGGGRFSAPARVSLVAAGVLVIAVGMVGGERFEYLGLWVHVLQHLLLGAAGPALIVVGAQSRFLGSVRRRPAAIAAVGYCLLQPALLVVTGSGVLEVHAVLHMCVHAAIVAAGLVCFQAALGHRALRREAATAQPARGAVAVTG